MTLFKHTIVLGLVFLFCACTQQPAHVQDKGNQFFGHEHEDALNSDTHDTYSENSPRYKEGYTRPVEQAAVPSVGVSDLAPPSQSPRQSENPQSKPFAATAPQDKPPAKVHVAGNTNGRFIWPVAGGKVISHFGAKPDGKSNEGINIAVAEGEPIWASADGMVVYAGNELKGYGNMVIIRHDDGWLTAYAHARSLSVKKNDYVKQSELIGYVGVTGGVKTPQVHFALRNGKTPVDPEKYLPSQ